MLGLGLSCAAGVRVLSVADLGEIVGVIRDIAFLLVLVVALLTIVIVYSKISSVLNSAKRTVEEAEDIVSTVAGRVVRPAVAGSGMVFGAGKVLSFFLGRSRKRRRKERGRSNGE